MKGTDDPSRLIRLQKKIFEHLQSQHRHQVIGYSKSLQHYALQYTQELKRVHAQPMEKKTLIQKIRTHSVTLIGDFHTFRHAQRTALRLMRDVFRPDEIWVLGLEFIPTSQQSLLDQFSAGKLTVEQLLEASQYSVSWGFPSKNYAQILRWAFEHQIRLLALNRSDDRTDLKLRDRWAAAAITHLFMNESPTLKLHLLVLMGDMHLADSHLPAEIRDYSKKTLGTALSALVIHQNPDQLYWKICNKLLSGKTNIFDLGQSRICIFSGTPWAKYQSLQSYLDTGNWDDEEPDWLSQVRVAASTIADFLSVAAPDFSHLTMKTTAESNFLNSAKVRKLIAPGDIALLKKLISRNQRFYLPHIRTAYLGSPSLNRASEMGSTILLRSYQRLPVHAYRYFKPDRDHFLRVALDTCFSFMGSLILNPRRKCDLKLDHEAKIRLLMKKKPLDRADLQARKLTLKLLSMKTDPARMPFLISKQDAETLYLTARHWGKILGHRLHLALLRGNITASEIRVLFLKRHKNNLGHSENHLRSLLKNLSGIRPQKSKSEVI